MNRVEEHELQLIDFSEEDDYLIAFPFRDSLEDLRLSVTFDNLNECDRIKLFESINLQVVERIDQAEFESMEPRRPSFLRKSLAWDSAFFTSAGVLNPEELFMINKGFKKGESNHSSPKTQRHLPPHRTTTTAQNQTSSASKRTNICPQNKVKPAGGPKSQGLKVTNWPKLLSSKQANKASVEGSDSGKTKNKTRKAGLGGPDLTVSKRSRWGDLSGLPKSTSYSSPITQKDSKVHCSYESSSSASPSYISIRRKSNHTKRKPTASPSSVQLPLSSTCSSSTSPCSSIEGWFSESLSISSDTHHSSPEYLTRSSMGSLLLSGGHKRKIKSSGLRMPSPKIGFFDEEQPLRGSMQVSFGKQSPLPNTNKLNKNRFHLSNLSPSVTPENCSKVRKSSNGEHDGRKVGASLSKLKPDGQIPKETAKNRMNIEVKKQKDEAMIDMKQKQDEDDQKENVCSFEDQVNGLTRYFEVIDLDRNVVPEVKGQLSVHCSRTPLAEKTSGKQ